MTVQETITIHRFALNRRETINRNNRSAIMQILVQCPKGHKLQVKEEYAGKKIRCPKCQEAVVVPAAEQATRERESTLAATEPQRGADVKQAPVGGAGAKRPTGRGKLPLFIGAGVIALMALAVAGYIVFKPKTAGGTPADDKADVEAVARQFVEAMRDGRDTAALFTEKARARATQMKHDRMAPGATYQITQTNLAGDKADVSLIVREVNKEHPLGLLLRREKPGQWRVYGLKARVMPEIAESEITMDLEGEKLLMGGQDVVEGMKDAIAKPFEEMNKELERGPSGKPNADDLAAAAFKSLSVQEFDAAWKNNLAVKDRPAADVLRELARKFALKLDLTPLQEKALAKPVTLDLKGQSRWQLVHAVCSQIGHYPTYEQVFTGGFGQPGGSETHVKLKQLPRLLPAAFAGPFLVEIESLDEFPPQAAGVIRPKVQAVGLPGGVGWSAMSQVQTFFIDELSDSQGRGLRDTSRGEDLWSGTATAGSPERTYDVMLKNLTRDVTAIKTFRGKLRVALPIKVEEVRFEPLAANTTKKVGNIEVTLKSATKTPFTMNNKPIENWSLRFEIKGATNDQLKFAAYNAKKELIGLSGGFSSGFDKVTQVEKSIQGQTPAAVVVKVVAETKVVEYDFHFENLPLTADPRKPEKIVPATFPGHETPFTLEFVKITASGNFSKAQFRLVNHSDKDLRAIDMKLDYLNAQGAKIKDWFRTSHAPTPMLPMKEVPILVARQGTVLVEIDAPFMPAGTAKINAIPLKAIFGDATVWEVKPMGK
jgi:hypothetical protein